MWTGVEVEEMTEFQAIEIVDKESVRRFPTTVTCSDYAEAKKIVLELAKKYIAKRDLEVKLP